MTEETDEFKKLSWSDQLSHKNWKARQIAYTNLTIKVKTWDENESDAKEFAHCIKGCLTDTNELQRNVAANLVQLYLKQIDTGLAKKSWDQAIQAILDKCLAKPGKLRTASEEIIMLYLELECDPSTLVDIFCEKMLKAKVPKVLTACIEIFTNCIKSYGNKCFKKKTLVGVVKAVMAAGIFGHRDKIVREAAKNLFVEIWNWENVGVRQVVESFKKVTSKVI